MKKFLNWDRILSCTVCSTVCHGLSLEIAVKHQHLKDNLTRCVTLFTLLQWLLFSRDTTKISIKSKLHLKDILGLVYFFSILSSKFCQQTAQQHVPHPSLYHIHCSLKNKSKVSFCHLSILLGPPKAHNTQNTMQYVLDLNHRHLNFASIMMFLQWDAECDPKLVFPTEHI